MFDTGASPMLGTNAFTDPKAEGKTINATSGEVIYYPDTAADNVYYIIRGQVRVYSMAGDDSSRLVEILGPGNWFGAAALAGQSTHRMRAVVVGSATIVEVRVEKLMAALQDRPEQLVELNRRLALKLVALTEEASRLVFEDCNQRLINTLLRFSNSAAAAQRGDGVVLQITHDQLAQAIGVARETVSLALTQLRQQNVLQTGRNKLVFNPETLRQFSSQQTGGRGQSAARAAVV